VARRNDNRNRIGAAAVAAAAALLALPGSASAAVSSDVTGGVLSVSSNASDAIAITVDGGNNVKVNGGNPGGGADVQATSITAIEVTGGPQANDIDLKAVTGTAFTALTSVEADGGDGNDTINGSQLADDLAGGDGNDRIIGDDNQAGTRDVSEGEAGDDTLVWNPGDDDDVNEGGAGDDTAEVNGGGKEQFEIAQSATTPGRVAFDRVQLDATFGAPFSVDVSDDTERLDLNAAAGDDIVNTGGGALGIALDIDGGAANDVLDGGDGADLISGGDGNDRILGDNNPAGTRDDSRGDAGDDTLVWNPGDGDDLNEGGAGNDTIEVNGGGVGEQFTVKPSTVAGRVLFDRTGPTPPGPFSLDIGTSERLDLNANGGDDSLNGGNVVEGLAGWTIDADGGDGNDTLAGASRAIDVLSGGAGEDTLRSRDETADTLSGGSEVDSAVVDAQDTVNADVEKVDRGQVDQPAPPADPGAPADPDAPADPGAPANPGVPADTVAPAVKVSRKAVAVNRRRVAAIRVTGAAGEASTVTVALRRNGRLLGRRTIELGAGQLKLAKVKLGRKTVALLKKRGSLRVKAVVTARDSAGNRKQRVVFLTLKR
jgi:Ca2+-binding RTX toxin-like protein